MLSIGTGSPPTTILHNKTVSRHCWPIRLFLSYMCLTQGQRAWNDLSGMEKQSPRQKRHYRLDITLEKPPALDDTGSMIALEVLVNRDEKLNKQVREISQRVFASLFYFELLEIPEKLGNDFNATGHVFCIRKAHDVALPQIFQRLCSSTIFINGKVTKSKPLIDHDGNIALKISFSTRCSLCIELKESGSRQSFPISGSPHTIASLISKGCLAAYFGRGTHKRRAVDNVCERDSKRRC